MGKSNILSDVQNILCDVLDEEGIILEEETSANDVDGWDSLTHIQFVVGIEKHFKIKFTSKEILSWRNVGEMLNCIQSKI
jgi:acyl carrier protein